MAPEVTIEYLVARAIQQYREKMVLQEEGKPEPEREPAARPTKSYTLAGMAQACLGCEISPSGDCEGTQRTLDRKRIPPLPCRDRQLLILMAKRRTASL
ncbi:MAG: hypothetical protein LUQ62_04325 [Methanomicrobiales archaeon]|nr:hypothetical protein [Methanomicrobiales archaeon]